MRPELSGLFRLWVLEQVRGGNVVSERKKEGRRERWGGGGRGWIERGRKGGDKGGSSGGRRGRGGEGRETWKTGRTGVRAGVMPRLCCVLFPPVWLTGPRK